LGQARARHAISAEAPSSAPGNHRTEFDRTKSSLEGGTHVPARICSAERSRAGGGRIQARRECAEFLSPQAHRLSWIATGRSASRVAAIRRS